MVYSAAMAAAIGEYLGETKEEIERGAAAYEPAGSRMHVITSVSYTHLAPTTGRLWFPFLIMIIY